MTPRHARQLDRMATLISYIAVAEGVAGDIDLEERLLAKSQELYDVVEMRESQSADPMTGLVATAETERVP